MRALLVGLILGGTCAAQTGAPPPKAGAVAHRHVARLYIYTTPSVRPRHRDVVRASIEKRAKTHLSCFARGEDGGPVLALGPVPRSRARLWSWRDGAWRDKTDAQAGWPFVAVLEYDGRSSPEAFVDWFRRKANSQDGGAWFKDPADSRYARHISAQTVCMPGDRNLRYMALCDAPSGEVMQSNEWVVRARIHWKDSDVEKRMGQWIRMSCRGKAAGWHADVVPLVSWLPRLGSGRRIRGVERVKAPEDQLVEIGARIVFTFPKLPPDVTPCGGR